jgi:hypothetical protein
MIKIELTLQQLQQLTQLLVIGMKAGDVMNMKVGLPLYESIEAQVNAQQQHKPE